MAGKQKGKDDTRYLWPEFSRLVGEIRPRWFVGENVPGIVHIAADDVCRDLERQGYEVGIWDYEAAAVGAQHRRERIFFVAHAGRALRQGSVEQRTLRDETQGGIANQLERPSSAYAANADSIRRGMRQLQENELERAESALNQADTGREIIANPDGERREEQRELSEPDPAYASTECSSRRKPEPRMDRMVDGLSSGMDGSGLTFWETEPEPIERIAHGVKDRVNRLKALGNAVVPQQAYPLFKAIMEAESEQV